MNENKWTNLQESYLNDLRKRRMSVLIYLMNGVKQYGHIESFDQHTILIRNGASQLVVYKHTVSTVMPTPKALGEGKPRPSAVAGKASAGSVTAPVIIRKTPPRRSFRGTDAGAGANEAQGWAGRQHRDESDA